MKRILVVGDRILDVYVYGQLLPSQDGCSKFVESYRQECPGGVDNAYRALARWQCSTRFALELETTSTKTRFIVDGHIALRHDREEAPSASALCKAREYCLYVLQTEEIDAVLLSDYDKGLLTEEFVLRVLCVAGGAPVVADAKRRPQFYEGCVLKCNSEYAVVYPEVLLRENAVVTYGPVTPTVTSALLKLRPQPPVRCVNHVGAGDCFAAHLTLALAHGFDLSDAAAIAHSAGRVYVQHPHNRPPTREEVRDDFAAVQ